MHPCAERQRMAALLGLGLVASFAITWTSAVVVDGSWAFGGNMVSDLGVSSTSARYIFGWGSIVSGAFGIAFGKVMSSMRGGPLSKTPFRLVMLAGLMLVLVGIFNEHTWPHGPSAVLLFVSIWTSMTILAIRDLMAKEYVLGCATGLMVLLNAIVGAITPLPFFEAVAVILFMVWVATISWAALNGCRYEEERRSQ